MTPLNLTTILLLPLIDDKQTLSFKELTGIKNTPFDCCYNVDINRPYNDCNIFMLFKQTCDEHYVKIMQNITKNKNYDKTVSYKINNKYYYNHIFKIPEKFVEDYFNLIDRRYNKVSKDALTKIKTYWSNIKLEVDIDFILLNGTNKINDVVPENEIDYTFCKNIETYL